MKEIDMAHITMAFIALLLLGIAILVTDERIKSIARMQAEEQSLTDFDDYLFVMPDGMVFSTRDMNLSVGQVDLLSEDLN